MPAYYNEHDRHAAAWLRELIKAGHIAPGVVDERSIVDVEPADLAGFTQCHFFAGIGVWSYVLRRAGWPDDRPVWTGSCPCQPFSAAGKGEGYADERHLWPAWLRLIRERRPAAIFGEQVDAAIRTGWLDDVCLSLEQLDYAVGAVSFPACSVGAPHIRQRLYFVADAQHPHRRPVSGPEQDERHRNDGGWPQAHGIAGACGEVCGLADASDPRRPGTRQHDGGQPQLSTRSAEHGVMGHAEQPGLEGHQRHERNGHEPGRDGADQAGSVAAPSGPVNGFWSAADWIPCRDGKARPVEPGTFPLAHGAAARVVRLRGYGNAICAPQAEEFVKAYLDQ